MYRFDPTISSAVEEAAAPPQQALATEEPPRARSRRSSSPGCSVTGKPPTTSPWARSTCRTTPLLREPLEPEHIKPRLLGHWGTSPGLSFIYAHLNRLIREHDLDAIFLAGPGHGGPAVLANVYLEGTYSEVYPDVSQDAAGMRRLFRQFSTPGGVPSHVSVPTPGSIHEGGELGYVLTHAFGAAFDNPDLLVCRRRRRRRGGDRTARGLLEVHQLPQPCSRRRGLADIAPQRLQDRQPHRPGARLGRRGPQAARRARLRGPLRRGRRPAGGAPGVRRDAGRLPRKHPRHPVRGA